MDSSKLPLAKLSQHLGAHTWAGNAWHFAACATQAGFLWLLGTLLDCPFDSVFLAVVASLFWASTALIWKLRIRFYGYHTFRNPVEYSVALIAAYGSLGALVASALALQVLEWLEERERSRERKRFITEEYR